MGPCIVGDKSALEIVHAWINAKFMGEERHFKRLEKLKAIENKLYK
jgi:ribose 5-phosphate isomerase RpiB